MVAIYAIGGEDSELYQVGGGVITTTAGQFRSPQARCALRVTVGGTSQSFWQYIKPFSQAVFWAKARLVTSASAGIVSSIVWQAYSLDGLPRLRIRCTVSGSPGTYVIEKVTTAGVLTTLATFFWSPTPGPAVPDQVDIFVNYAVAGEVSLYFNRNLVATTGTGVDVTTNSITALVNLGYGNHTNTTVTATGCNWSEAVVSDTDTRSWNLQGFPAVANGNTHNFDTGTPAAANVNEISIDYSTLDGSTTAGQIDEYTTGAVAAGTYSIIAYVVSAVMQKGATGPSKADLLVRTGSADWPSTDQVLTVSWDTYQYVWLLNPNTGVAWLPGDVGAAVGFNIGIKSIT